MSRKKAAIELLTKAAEHVERGVPYSLTFAPTGRMTKAEVERLEADLKQRFEQWHRTWVDPYIEQAIKHINSVPPSEIPAGEDLLTDTWSWRTIQDDAAYRREQKKGK